MKIFQLVIRIDAAARLDRQAVAVLAGDDDVDVLARLDASDIVDRERLGPVDAEGIGALSVLELQRQHAHVIHGLLFYGLLWLFFRRAPVERRFLIATLVEIAWELAENSNWAINRYREATIAVGYTGDSVLNTLSDIGMMMLGFWLARKLPLWASAMLVIALEAAALIAVRDNLTLNVWMFLFPTDFIRAWQSG